MESEHLNLPQAAAAATFASKVDIELTMWSGGGGLSLFNCHITRISQDGKYYDKSDNGVATKLFFHATNRLCCINERKSMINVPNLSFSPVLDSLSSNDSSDGSHSATMLRITRIEHSWNTLN